MYANVEFIRTCNRIERAMETGNWSDRDQVEVMAALPDYLEYDLNDEDEGGAE
jgi:hypothetical protein